MITLKHSVILASASRARNEMLTNAGLSFTATPADIDEDKLLNDMRDQGASPNDIASKLADEKARHVSSLHPNAYVIGSDQILEFDGNIFQKAGDENAAKEKLKTLRGQTHHLISSVSIAYNNEIIWRDTDTAALTMHDFDDEFLDQYLAAAKDDILSCVGAYAFEKHGAWLFKSIDANYFTILGMPLLPLLAYLRKGN